MVTLRLDSRPLQAPAPTVLDSQQQAVVGHRRGAMRVLAGPGTGKTTTLVAAMAARLVGDDRLAPDQVLGLTFGRRAALHWRDRVTAAAGGGLVPTVSTFHSFCYALLRKFAPNEAYYIATRLLSGPEQQVRARTLFIDAVNEGRVPWPEDLREAVTTRGLAEEIRAVMARTRSHAMDPADLDALARADGLPLWSSVAAFMDEYLDVLGFEGVLDYSELVYRTMLLCDEPEVRSYLHGTFAAIYVDEYQDTDPGQIELLRKLVTPSTTLVVVGDFDQGIYGFRGADEAGIRLFREQFSDIYGDQIHDVVLTTCRRFGGNIRAAADVAISRYLPLRIDPELVARHREPECPASDRGTVRVLSFDSDGAQAAHIADLIARQHAMAGRAWSDMAVIVRSATASIPAIYRALVSAGVPTEVATDEIPLHADPAVAPLLAALTAVNDARAITADVAFELLTGPLAGVDPLDLRRWGRYLRDWDRQPERVPEPSSRLIARALADPDWIAGNHPQRHAAMAATVRTLGGLLVAARNAMVGGASPHQVLWHIWDGTEWPRRLQRQALGAGMSSQRANRDLDAICALFDIANRFVARGGAKGLANFLDELMAQQIPAETLAENDVRADTVRVLTAHRAKGLEWPFVVVAGVQEDLWPNLVVPSTVLQPERIGHRVVTMPATVREMLDAERRLFFVALTRAQEELVVTTVDTSDQDDGIRPSRFVEDLLAAAGLDRHGEKLGGVAPTVELDFRRCTGRPAAALSPDSIVARLRSALDDDDPAVVRAAARRLSDLANSGVSQFRNANPATWWGTLPVTSNDQGPAPVPRLSGTGIDDIERCPAKWFLERKVNAVVVKQNRMVFGSALHKIAEGLALGQIETDIDAIHRKIDALWPGMGYDVEWEAAREREQARDASARLLSWFLDHSTARAEVEAQLGCTTRVPRSDGTGEIEVSLTGWADRIEISMDGAVIYDFKTGGKSLGNLDLARHLQLALYEFMLTHGHYTAGGAQAKLDVPVTGAALVMLRLDSGEDDGKPLVQQVAPGAHDAARNVTPLAQRIAAAAEIVLDERYETKYSDSTCRRCDVRFLCPASPDGRQVLS